MNADAIVDRYIHRIWNSSSCPVRDILVEMVQEVAREERERCAKAVCVDCRNGLPYTGNGRHSEDDAFMGYECRAAAIRSLEDL